MLENDFVVSIVKLNLVDRNILQVIGFFPDDNPDGRNVCVYINGKKHDITITTKDGPVIRRRYMSQKMNVGIEITGEVCLNEFPADIKSIKITSCLKDHEATVCSITGKKLHKLFYEINSTIDLGRFEDGKLILSGWAASANEVNYSVLADGKPVDFSVANKFRKDVVDIFSELGKDTKAGFELTIPDKGYKNIKVALSDGDRCTQYSFPSDDIKSGKVGQRTDSLFMKGLGYLRRKGFKKTVKKVILKYKGKQETVTYNSFLEKYGLKEDELAIQRKTVFDSNPLFSIVVPLYRTKESFLKELIDSVVAQTYPNWELCLADGSGSEHALRDFIEKKYSGEKRIKYNLLDKNDGISGNTNAALEMATGDFIVFSDHDDLLSPNALFECALAVNNDDTIDIIYSDEDKVDMTGKVYFEPHFKSDFNMDLLCSINYICHLFVCRRDVYEKVGNIDSRYDGAQDHDFVLRCAEVAENICHIPKVLYHWRCHQDSTAENPESKLYAFENGCKAVEAHYNRIGIPATVEQGVAYGLYRTRYHWEERPLVSILIPNKDHIEDLKKCIDSINERSTYRNYEFVIVENNSTEKETFAYYDEISKADNVTVLYYKGEFNYSAINNFGAKETRGEYILLLNNDTEMINPDAIKEMVDICMRDDVGIVGAKLLYDDNTIQHAGVVIGFGGIAGHTFIGFDKDDYGYFSRIQCVQDYSAVTAACLMVKKSVFDEVEGLEESFKVAFNDIDFCMKVRAINKLVVYCPYATFYHYESKSRGLEDSSDKIERFNGEIERFWGRWKDFMQNGDPYYNPNLTLDRQDFSLKE